MSRHYLSLPLGVALAAFALPAMAELKYESQNGGSVVLYGQISLGYQLADDGDDKTANVVDNSASNTRIGLWVTQPFAAGIFTFNLETALGFRASGGISQTYTPDVFDWERENIRRVDFAFESPVWGKIYLGQGSMATDGTPELDFSNTSMTTYAGMGDFAGAMYFRDKSGALSTVAAADVTDDFSGSRRARIRYDSPAYQGFSLSLAAGQEVLSHTNDDDYYDVAVNYSSSLGETAVAGAFGFSSRDMGHAGHLDQTMGSVAFDLPSGINIAFAGGTEANGGNYGYMKLGYHRSFSPIGETSFAIDYLDGSDYVSDGSSTNVLGIGVNQAIDRYNVQLYAGYRKYSFEERGRDYADIDAYQLGMLWNF